MKLCTFRKDWLQSFADDEPCEGTEETRQHVADCEICAHEIAEWKKIGESLRTMVEEGVVEAEPLSALEHIRKRVQEKAHNSLLVRIRDFIQDLFLFRPWTVASIGVAVVLGALVAPGLIWLAYDSVSTNQVKSGLSQQLDRTQQTITTGISQPVGFKSQVRLVIHLVHATQGSQQVDPEIQALLPILKNPEYSKYRLLQKYELFLSQGASSSLKLPNGSLALIQAGTIQKNEAVLLKVSTDQEPFSTTVEIQNEKSIRILGPLYQDGILILAITRIRANH